MRVIVAGASGFVGRRLCALLRESGHEPIALTRQSPAPEGALAWDGRGLGPWAQRLEGAGAVVNLAGENIAAGRWSAARKRQLVESRLLATRALVQAILAAKEPPKSFVCASAVGYYGDRGEQPVDESAGPGSDFLARLCVEWELEAQRAQTRCLVARLRLGVVIGPGGGALAKMLPPFRLGLGGPLGCGRQWMSWISLDDAAALARRAAEGGLSGAVNAVSPHPVRNAEFAAALGRRLGRPAFLRAPAFALKLALGEMAEMLLGGQRVVPAKALAAGHAFAQPQLDAALAAALPA